MDDMSLRLDHLNIPAQDPEGLARWYAEHFDLNAEGRRVSGPGLLIAFQSGEPVERSPDLHFGFRVPSMAALRRRASRFGVEVAPGTEFTAFRVFDPERNCIEVYCRTEGK